MSKNSSPPPDPPRPGCFALSDCPAAANRRDSLAEREPSFSTPPELAPPVAASAPERPSQSSESSRISDGGAGRRRSFLNSCEDSDEINALLDSGSDDDDNEDEDEDEACSLAIEFPDPMAAGNGYAVNNSRKRKIQDFYMELPLSKVKSELPRLSNGGFSGKFGREFDREVGREFCEEVGGEFGRQFGEGVGGDFSDECGVAQGIEFVREAGREFSGDFSDECGVVQEYETSSVVVDDDEKKKKKMMTMTGKKSRGRKVRKTVNLMRSLIPGGGKLDSLSVFDEVIKYVKMLQQEVSLLEGAKKG